LLHRGSDRVDGVCALCRSSAIFTFINLRGQYSRIDGVTMEVSGWEQLVRLWELIVLVCKFLWNLLRLLGGG